MIILSCLSPDLPSETWPSFQHDTAHTGYTGDSLAIPLEPKWSRTLSGIDSMRIGPVVADDQMAVTGVRSLADPLADPSPLVIVAVRLTDAEVLWRKPTGGHFMGPAQIQGGIVYAVTWNARSSKTDPHGSTLWALRASDGGEVWKKEFSEWWAAPPAVSDDTVICPVLFKPDSFTGEGGTVYAFKASDGTPIWQFPTRKQYEYIDYNLQLPHPPVIHDGRVFFQDSNCLYSVKITDETKVWEKSDYSGDDFKGIYRPMAAADGKFFFAAHFPVSSGQPHVVAVNAADGSELWKFPTGNPHALSLSGGALYSAVYIDESHDRIYSLDPATGSVLHQSGDLTGEICSIVLTGDGNVYSVSSDPLILDSTLQNPLFDWTLAEHGVFFHGGDVAPALVEGLFLSDIREEASCACLTATGTDATPPTGAITSPEGPLSNPPEKITIEGYAYDFNLKEWFLEYAPQSDPSSWSLIESGTNYIKSSTVLAFKWNVRAIGDGDWVIRLRVEDDLGLSFTDDHLKVRQDHTPPGSVITYPTDGATLDKLAFTVAGTASDNMQLAKVELWDSVTGNWQDAAGTATWSLAWSTSKSCMDVTFKSRATDWAGNVETPSGGVTVTLSPNVRVVPVYPSSNAETSEIMQGGEIHRWFRVEDAGGQPVEKARVFYSTAGSPGYAVADDSGVVDLAVDSTDLLSGSDPITGEVNIDVDILEVKYSSCIFSPVDPFPSFPVTIRPREAEHVWVAGLSGTLKAGITAYVEGEIGGGMEVSAANNSDISITQNFEAGVGVGVEVGPEFDMGVADAGAQLGASVGVLFRGDQEFNMGDALDCDTGDPDCENRRKAYASLMIVSMARTASALYNPTVTAILDALTAVGYSNYLERKSAAMGIAVSAGGSVSGGVGLESDSGAGANLGVGLVDASVDLAYLVGMNVYPKDQLLGIQLSQELETQVSALTFSVAGQDAFNAGEYFGLDALNNTIIFTEELIFDASANPRAFILTIGDGEEGVAYIVDDMQQVETLLATGAANIRSLGQSFLSDPAGGLQLGLQSCSNELSHLIGALESLPIRFERTAVHSIRDFDLELSLDFNIQVITIGVGESVHYQEKRVYLAETGVMENGKRRVLSSYDYDTYARGDTNSLEDLMAGILDGMWSFVDGALDWVTGKASSFKEWTIEQIPIIGGATLMVDSPTTTPWARLSGAAHSVPRTTDIAILSYEPGPNPIRGLFVVGKCHDFQPPDLEPLLPLDLEIGYGELPGSPSIPPSRLDLYHWKGTPGKWRPVGGAVIDHPSLTASAPVLEMGIYAVGVDLTTPTITLLTPASDGFTTSGAMISARVTDDVSGVKNVVLEIDGNTVSSSFSPSDGIMSYIPDPPLSQGSHEIEITATDHADNAGSLSWNLKVDDQPPRVALDQPVEGAVIRGVMDVNGTAADDNIDFYLVQLIPEKGSALWWVGLPVRISVDKGLLASFDTALLEDGEYDLVLRARDLAGNENTARVAITLKNHGATHGLLLR